MARKLHQLNALKITHAKPGFHADGGGLYLQVKRGGKSWLFRYRDRSTGKDHWIGLGAIHTVPLAMARELAQGHRQTLLAGNDPLAMRRQEQRDRELQAARVRTFGWCCEQYVDLQRDTWRNAKHAAQWKATLGTYGKSIWSTPVADIDTALVIHCLSPAWKSKTETMTRVRQRIEAVLGWATVSGFREGDNPARWRNHLAKALPMPTKIKRTQSRVALPYTDMHDFIVELRQKGGLAARAVELQILTATRPGEVAGARWDEIDMAAKVWTIPPERIKGGTEHRVPLSPTALTVLRGLPHTHEHVFPGQQDPRKSITTAAMLKAVRAIRAVDSHGFRSSFRDWCAEQTSYAHDVCERALAHVRNDKSEAAYLRTDHLAKRKLLMSDWAKHCDTPAASGNVSPIRSGASR